MRITKNMMMSTVQMNMNRVQRQMFQHQVQIASNKRIQKPSDDPIGTTKALDARTALAKNEQFQRNVIQAESWLTITDSTMSQVQDLLMEVQIAATKGASSNYGVDERHNMAKNISQQLETLFNYSETKFDGRYIFGGAQTQTQPFSSSSAVANENFTAQSDRAVELNNVHLKSTPITVTSSDALTTFTEGTDFTIDQDNGTITVLSTGSMLNGQGYLINYETDSFNQITTNPKGINGAINRQIGENLEVKVNMDGNELFTDEINMFDLLMDLRKKLERDDTTGVLNLIDGIQNAIDYVASANGDVGARLNQVSLSTEFLERENIFLEDYRAQEEDINITEAMIKYQSYETAYEATIATSTKLLKNSILNYI